MKYLDEYRNADAARQLAAAIARATTRPWNIMEVCGGQTHAILRFGLDEMLPPEINLIHGPGCPVCVTPMEMIDRALAIAARPEVIFCSFGDMLRVPGSTKDLFTVKSEGGDVRIVYSPMDAVALAQKNPGKQVVFFAVGFETTAPANAMAVVQAVAAGADELLRAGLARVWCRRPCAPCSIRPPTACKASWPPATSARSWALREYEPIAEKYHVPIVVTGFEPLDILQGVLMCVRATRSRPGRGREPIRPGRARRRQSGRLADLEGCLRGRAAEVARDRRDPGQRLVAPRGLRPVRRRSPFRRRPHHGRGAGGVHRRAGLAGPEEAARVYGLRRPLHAGPSPRRSDGVVGRGVLSLLSLPPAGKLRTVVSCQLSIDSPIQPRHLCLYSPD